MTRGRRPTNEAQFAQALMYLSDGYRLERASRMAGICRQTLFHKAKADPQFAQQLQQARDAGEVARKQPARAHRLYDIGYKLLEIERG